MKKYQLEIYCFDPETCDDYYIWIDSENVELPAELLAKMGDLGIVEMKGNQVRADQIRRAYKALRLHRTLGVNLSGTAIILELLDRMEQMQEELEKWKKS